MGRTQPRVYADASAYGGCFDEEFAAGSLAFFEGVRDGRWLLVLSPLVVRELRPAPRRVNQLLAEMAPLAEDAAAEDAAVVLRSAYLAAGIVTPKYEADALHVATAVLSRCDAIVSWNFRHIVHPDKIARYNGINSAHGYGAIAIITPAEVVGHEEDV